MKNILFIHGFASSSLGLKANHLRSLNNINAIIPDLPISPFEAICFLEDIINKESNDNLYLIGSSLGGFYAFYLSYKLKVKSILINPSMFPVETTGNYLGEHQRWMKNESFIWTQAHVSELQTLSDEIMDALDTIDKSLIRIYLAIHDEVLDVDKIRKFFKGYNLEMVDSDHRFGLKEFKRILLNEFNIS